MILADVPLGTPGLGTIFTVLAPQSGITKLCERSTQNLTDWARQMLHSSKMRLPHRAIVLLLSWQFHALELASGSLQQLPQACASGDAITPDATLITRLLSVKQNRWSSAQGRQTTAHHHRKPYTPWGASSCAQDWYGQAIILQVASHTAVWYHTDCLLYSTAGS